MPTTSSWQIGAFHNLPNQTIVVNGGGQTVPTGDYYLWHSTASISLIDQLAVEILKDAGISSVVINIQQDRKVFINADSTFTLNWTSILIRDLLGFTGNLAGSDDYTALNVSPLLWSAGKTESPELGALGTDGALQKDTQVGQSATTNIRAITHNNWRINRFVWRYVLSARYQTPAELGGEFFAFWDQVLSQAFQFTLWRNVTEDDGSTTLATPLGANIGPYKMRGDFSTFPFRREGGLEFVDLAHRVELDVVQVAELSNA